MKFNQNHPVILSSKHKFSELFVKEYYILYLHIGSTLLSHIIKQSYWIIGEKKIINKLLLRCINYHTFKTSTALSQLIASLYEDQVTSECHFFSCGVDYSEAISIKFNNKCGDKSIKGYMELFICLATKDLHIEAVRDLTGDAFIAFLMNLVLDVVFPDIFIVTISSTLYELEESNSGTIHESIMN